MKLLILGTMAKVQQLYGGVSVRYQQAKLKDGCSIVVATPGRLHQFVKDGYVSVVCVYFCG